ncbi:MAG: hypothetical protein V1930_00450 [Pseudomonadota bacterium]
MYISYKLMAVFWTLAEGIILVFMRWGFLFLKKGQERQNGFLISFAILLALLTSLFFWGENAFGKIIDLEKGLHLSAYRWAIWNFFCSLWVILEGVIMIYGFRIYKILKSIFKNEIPKKAKVPVKRADFAWGIPLLVLFFLLFYSFFECTVLSMIIKHGMDAKNLRNVSLFYIRICGLFWIFFEWVIALLTIKIYVLLKSERGV